MRGRVRACVPWRWSMIHIHILRPRPFRQSTSDPVSFPRSRFSDPKASTSTDRNQFRTMILPRASGTPAETVGSEFGTTPNTKPEPRFDGVGIWWFTFAAVWTVLLVCGMTFLYRKRDTPTLRLRSLSLTFSGIILLHFYWLSVQIAYSIGPLAPEVAEYWVMGVWYPFGIALFQAGNSQFLYVAKAQSRFARPPSQMKTRYDEKRSVQKPSFLQRIKQMDYSKRMFMFVTMGMTVQVRSPSSYAPFFPFSFSRNHPFPP